MRRVFLDEFATLGVAVEGFFALVDVHDNRGTALPKVQVRSRAEKGRGGGSGTHSGFKVPKRKKL